MRYRIFPYFLTYLNSGVIYRDSTFKNVKSGHLAKSDMVSKRTNARTCIKVFNTHCMSAICFDQSWPTLGRCIKKHRHSEVLQTFLNQCTHIKNLILKIIHGDPRGDVVPKEKKNYVYIFAFVRNLLRNFDVKCTFAHLVGLDIVSNCSLQGYGSSKITEQTVNSHCHECPIFMTWKENPGYLASRTEFYGTPGQSCLILIKPWLSRDEWDS
jgi:hypothetical protein